jgi:hypothetical protein
VADEFEVREQLCVVRRDHLFDGLEFDDDPRLDQQIQSIAGIDLDSFIPDWQRHLSVNVQSSLAQLVGQTRLIGRLQQTRSQLGMNFHGGVDDLSGDVIQFHFLVLPKSFTTEATVEHRDTIRRGFFQLHVSSVVLSVLCGLLFSTCDNSELAEDVEGLIDITIGE